MPDDANRNTTVKRVAIVEDDPDMCAFLEDVLAGDDEFVCAGCFPNAAKALLAIPALRPEVVLMDIHLPGRPNGVACAADLKRLMPVLRVIMVTGCQEAVWLERSLKAGVDDYLTKPVSASQCLATLRFVVRDRPATKACPAPQHPLLNARENEVMALLAEGLLYKEIADRLGLSECMVHKHLTRAYRILGAANRTEAIINWRGEGGRRVT